jgi:hypothetical protein
VVGHPLLPMHRAGCSSPATRLQARVQEGPTPLLICKPHLQWFLVPSLAARNLSSSTSGTHTGRRSQLTVYLWSTKRTAKVTASNSMCSQETAMEESREAGKRGAGRSSRRTCAQANQRSWHRTHCHVRDVNVPKPKHDRPCSFRSVTGTHFMCFASSVRSRAM